VRYAEQLLGKAWVRYALLAAVALMLAAALSFGVADRANATHSLAISGWYCWNAWDYKHWWACYYYDYYYHTWVGPYYPFG
jgi:hypothetical protein